MIANDYTGTIKILKIIKSYGFEAYIVGGWVRDKIIGRESSDIDLTTNATPEDILTIFKDDSFHVIPTGINHGTVTIIHSELTPKGVEITSYRKETQCDGRHAEVEFTTDLITDLSRRDLTINSLGYDPIDGVYFAPFNGMEDIKHRIIRCVGDPDKRFQEDNLRMLRALRFYATLGEHWVIDRDTRNAIAKNAHLIKGISNERIKMEIDKCFAKADNPSKMFYQMRETGLLKFIMPELNDCYNFAQNKYHKWDVFTHTLLAVDAVPKEYPLIRWAGLFHDLGKPASCENYGEPHASFHMHEKVSVRLATTIMKRLRFSNDDKEYVNNLINCHMFRCSDTLTDGAIRRLIAKLGVEYIDDLTILKYGDARGNGKRDVGELTLNTTLRKRADKIIAEDSAFKVTSLDINGAEIMELLNIPAGPAIGVILNALLEEVLDNPELNTKEILSKMITKKRVKESNNGMGRSN